MMEKVLSLRNEMKLYYHGFILVQVKAIEQYPPPRRDRYPPHTPAEIVIR